MGHDILTPLRSDPPAVAATAAPAERRCAIYARVSVSSSDTGLNSIDAQVQACEEFIRSQRSLGWHLAAPPFIDDGYSGGSLDRPALIELLKDVEAGRFDAVVVHRLDRLCRTFAISLSGLPRVGRWQRCSKSSSCGAIAPSYM